MPPDEPMTVAEVSITYMTTSSGCRKARFAQQRRTTRFRHTTASNAKNAPSGIDVFANAECPRRPPMINSAW